MVAPAGTTFGVADPTSRKVPPSSPSATNKVARPELLLSTVMVQLRAFGGTGPAAGGRTGAGVGVGLGETSGAGVGKTGGAGVGKAGNDGSDTPAGTYRAAAPFETQLPSSLQSLPPATRTVPSSSGVNELTRHQGMPETVVHDPVRVVQVHGDTALRRVAAPGQQHRPIRQQHRGTEFDAGCHRELGPAPGSRIVDPATPWNPSPTPCHRAAASLRPSRARACLRSRSRIP